IVARQQLMATTWLRACPPALDDQIGLTGWFLLLCRFSDAGNDGAIDALGRPASEKRQGRKSRSVVQRRCGVRYGDLAAGLELMRLDRSRCGGRFTVNRGWTHRGEGGSARCTTGLRC